MVFIDLQEDVEALFATEQELFDYAVRDQTLSGYEDGGRREYWNGFSVPQGCQAAPSDRGDTPGRTGHLEARPWTPERRKRYGGAKEVTAERKAYKTAHKAKSAGADIQRRLLAGERPAWCTHGKGRPPARWIRIAAEMGIELKAPAAPGKEAA